MVIKIFAGYPYSRQLRLRNSAVIRDFVRVSVYNRPVIMRISINERQLSCFKCQKLNYSSFSSRILDELLIYFIKLFHKFTLRFIKRDLYGTMITYNIYTDLR